ncbi:Ca-activated chloride channel family protein [Ekhidna lutea]|uniref:Ca-activated chloride channel family protein n=1 Tax=Ekhidna lutea TaxID=447679 RepID=A0A239LAA0_EKHLU|nr:VWA domain-containing protein [Ekhidna lutea]SNT27205.1 Ca-activated chloride channel family protein [Ekhidna lutea]
MKWVNAISTFELVLISIFVILYLAFIWRVISTTRRLGLPATRVLIKTILRTVYFALIITALLGPSFGDTSREVKTVGKDIFICIDLSQSMNATDVQPSRLEKVKFELKSIVEAFSSDRIGLIMFSSEAYMQCPLTYDNNALNLFIQTLNTNMVPNFGTDFGPPLEMAIEKLIADDTVVTRSKSKITILISDGEDFGDNTDEIASDLENEGITLFTLGVGTKKGSKIPTRNGFKTDNSGNEVVSQLNSTSLEDLAENTGGEYFEINESRNDVARLISAINNVEGETRDSKQVDATQNRYFYFLGLAFLLMVLDVVFSVKLIKL